MIAGRIVTPNGKVKTSASLVSMKITVRGETDIGLTRSSNQDAFLIDNTRKLYIVADGMGGHAGGEVASDLCVRNVSSWVKEHSAARKLAKMEVAQRHDHICSLLVQAINHASTSIFERSLEEPQLMGMGTTASALMIYNDHAYIGHVGDSRIYLIRDRFIYQLTNDHSLIGEQLRAGVLSHEEAKNTRMQNVITRSVGYQEMEDVDTSTLPIEKGDIFALSSDGLHGRISDEEISRTVNEKKINAVKDLVELANARGGKDNITMIVVAVGS